MTHRFINAYGYVSTGTGVTILEEIEHESLVDPEKIYTSAAGNMPNAYEWLGVGGYAIIGFTWSNKLYPDNFSSRYKEIRG